jgi:hypothetical protein
MDTILDTMEKQVMSLYTGQEAMTLSDLVLRFPTPWASSYTRNTEKLIRKAEEAHGI